jgi:hypothetical protein
VDAETRGRDLDLLQVTWPGVLQALDHLRAEHDLKAAVQLDHDALLTPIVARADSIRLIGASALAPYPGALDFVTL